MRLIFYNYYLAFTSGVESGLMENGTTQKHQSKTLNFKQRLVTVVMIVWSACEDSNIVSSISVESLSVAK